MASKNKHPFGAEANKGKKSALDVKPILPHYKKDPFGEDEVTLTREELYRVRGY